MIRAVTVEQLEGRDSIPEPLMERKMDKRVQCDCCVFAKRERGRADTQSA